MKTYIYARHTQNHKAGDKVELNPTSLDTIALLKTGVIREIKIDAPKEVKDGDPLAGKEGDPLARKDGDPLAVGVTHLTPHGKWDEKIDAPKDKGAKK